MSFSKVLIFFRFDLISSFSNLTWHLLYTWEFLRCLFANLKRRNFGITPFFLQSNKKLRSKWHFSKLKIADFKLRKCHLDLSFLLGCKKNGVILKFLRFKLANRHLNNSHVYKKCKIRLLEDKLKSKGKRINTLEKHAQRVKEIS